jgi:hypothetical protein
MRQKNRRPKGFSGNGGLASLLLSHRPLAGMVLRRASPSSHFLKNAMRNDLRRRV